MVRRSSAALVLLTLVVGLGACSRNERDGGPRVPEATRQAVGSIATDPRDSAGPAAPIAGARRGGTVTVLRETRIAHLDPQRVYSFVGLTVSQLYARRLTAFKDDGKGRVVLVGDLAETPGTDVHNDCRVWRYRIKEGVRFEDGSPITSREIAYGIARSFDLSLAGGPTYLQEWLADTPQFDTRFDFAGNRAALPPGLSAPDARTLTFTFARPHCDLPFAASLPATAPVPPARDTGTEYDKRPFSSGPYKVAEHEAGTRLTFDRNPHWDPATDAVRHQYPDRFTYEFGADPVTQTNRIIADNGGDRTAVSFNGVDPSLVSKVVRDTSLKARTLQEPTPTENTLTINNNRVTELKVRQALNFAIDRDGVVKTLGGRTVARPVTTLMPPATIGWRPYDAYPAGRTGNPGRARELLGGRTPELVLAFADDATNQLLAIHLKGNLERAGFKITLKPIPADTFLDETKKRDNPWDLYIGSWGADWPSGAAILPVLYDGRALKDGGSNNGTSYLDAPALSAEFDRILALPVAEQAAEWGRLDEKIMKTYAPVVPLYVDVMFTIHGSKLGGIFIDSIWGSVAVTNAYVKA